MWHPDVPELYRDKIVRGDLLRLLLALPDESVDAVVTDPPYSSGGMFRGDRTNANTRSKYQNTETMKQYPEFFPCHIGNTCKPKNGRRRAWLP